MNTLNRSAHHNKHLQHSWHKHGSNAFALIILETVDKQLLACREQVYLDSLVPEYNILRIAHSAVGYRHTPEEIEASRVRNREHWAALTPIERAEKSRMLGASHKGVRLGEETRRRMSQAKTGVVKSPEWIAKVAAANMGTYTLLSPEGVDVVITGLGRFCRERGLSQGTLGMVIAGKRSHHKGWKVKTA